MASDKVCKICGYTRFLCSCHSICTTCDEYSSDCTCYDEEDINALEAFDSVDD